MTTIQITAPNKSLFLSIGFLPQQSSLQIWDSCSGNHDHPTSQKTLHTYEDDSPLCFLLFDPGQFH